MMVRNQVSIYQPEFCIGKQPGCIGQKLEQRNSVCFANGGPKRNRIVWEAFNLVAMDYFDAVHAFHAIDSGGHSCLAEPHAGTVLQLH
jgi:hypothetical protein